MAMCVIVVFAGGRRCADEIVELCVSQSGVLGKTRRVVDVNRLNYSLYGRGPTDLISVFLESKPAC